MLEAGYDSLSSSFLGKKQYNSENASGFPLGVSGASSFVAANKGRKLNVGRLACRVLDQNNSFFRLLRKTIHQAVNPQFDHRAYCKQQAVARAFISTEKEVKDEQAI